MTIADILKSPPWNGQPISLRSETRCTVRTWLSRCGVPTKTIFNLTIQQLEACYSDPRQFESITGLNAQPQFVSHVNSDYKPRNAALIRWLNSNGHSIPVPAVPAQPQVPDVESDTETETVQSPAVSPDTAKQLADLIAKLTAPAGITETRVRELITERVADLKPEVRVEKIILRDRIETKVESAVHSAFDTIIQAVYANLPVLIVGPAGSGKTHLCAQIAETLKLTFRFTGAVDSAYKLLGFVDAQGRTVRTPYRDSYEHGGVFLWDEMDASAASALLAFNAGLANGHQDFPDTIVPKHDKTRLIASANTYGRGHDRVYVGRSQLDAASIDRFVVIPLDYDEKLEVTLYGNTDWTHHVQKVRSAVRRLNIRHVVSMRAVAQGKALLEQGMKQEEVEAYTLWRGLDAGTVSTIKAGL